MILLDTHIWVRWLISDNIDSELTALIENSEDVCVSSISCWEVVYLAKRGRMELPLPASPRPCRQGYYCDSHHIWCATDVI